MAEQGRREVAQRLREPQYQTPTVPLSPVMAPQRSAYGKENSLVGQLLSETAKYGSVVFSNYLERANNEALLEGQAAYAQGKTYKELQESGADKFTENGWKLMEAQTAGAQWYAAQKEKIGQGDAAMNPDEYRRYLSSTTADMLQGRDEANTRFVMSMASKYIPQLVSEQTASHFKYREEKTYEATVNSIVGLSKSPNDKNDLLGTMSRPEVTGHADVGSPAGALTMPKYREALTQGILTSFEQDNPNAYRTFKDAGYLEKAGLTSDQLARIRNAEQGWQNREKNKYDEKVTLAENDLLNRLKDQKISLPEALQQAKQLTEARGLRFDAGDAKTWVSANQSNIDRERSEARADARAVMVADRNEKKADARNRETALAYSSWLDKRDSLDKELLEGKITPSQYRTRGIELADEVGLKLNTGVVGNLEAEVNKVFAQTERLRQKNLLIDNANATEDYSQLDAGDVQAAITKKKQQFAKEAQNDIASGRVDQTTAVAEQQKKYLDWWDRTGLVDNQTQRVFRTFLNSNSVKSDGTVPDNSVQAFAQFADLYSRNPHLAMRHVEGADNQARAKAMLAYHQAPGDFGEAIKNYWMAEKSGMSAEKAQAALNAPRPSEAIAKATREYFERENVSAFSAMFNPNADVRQAFRVSDRDIRTARQYDAVLEEQVKERATSIIRANPGIDPQAATEAAITNVRSRAVMFGGTVVVGRQPGEVLNKMFGEGGAATYGNRVGVGHDALMTYMQKYGKDLWGDAFHDVDWGKSLLGAVRSDIRQVQSEGAGALLNPGTYLQGMSDGVSDLTQAVRTKTVSPPLSVTESPDGSGLLVRYERPDGTLSPIRAVPYRSMGKAWENEYKERLAKNR